MKHTNLRVPWHTHWYRAARAPFVGDERPWHTHLWRGCLSLCGRRRYAPPSVRELLQTLLAEARDARVRAEADAASLEAVAKEIHRVRLRTNKTVLRHIAELGRTDARAGLSQAFLAATATIEPLITARSTSIAVCTVALGADYRQQTHRCLASQARYCERQGYTFADLGMLPSFPLRPAAWHKLLLAHRLLQAGHEHVLFLDADCLVTNPDIRVEELVAALRGPSAEKSMLVTSDESSINTGVFFIRNTPDAFRLLDMLWLYDAGRHQPNWEQDALHWLLEDHPEAASPLAIEPDAKRFNSFPHERQEFFRNLTNRPNAWSPGDFVCHFSGIRPPHLQRMIDQYADETAER